MKDIQNMFLDSFKLYSDEIFRFAFFRLDDREKAKDIVQEVFMKTWLYLSKGNDIKNMRAFLYKTANNLVIDEYRKSNRSNQIESIDEKFEDGYDVGFDDTKSWSDKIDGEKVIKLANLLPDLYSEVIFLKYVEEKTISEISVITGQTENSVSVRINRAIKKLKELVLEEKQK